jgi:hypothetical protein
LVPDQLKITQVAFHAFLVLGGDVGFTEEHKVIDVVTGIKEQAAHAESVTISSLSTMGRMCKPTISWTYFMIVQR